MSCNEISIEEFDKTIPVSPPTVNKKMNPKAHSIGESKIKCDPMIVASQLKIFTPVGIAMIMVAAVK